jgi:radical SAM superfamily enzyme YgiQ (UPF0313 family)
LNENLDKNAQSDIKEIFEYMADRILQNNPTWVALSLLTHLSQNSTRWLCFVLKQKDPQIKIVIGGAGCFSTLKGIDSFTMELKSQKLIDHFIVGDGENALVQLITGTTQTNGIDSYEWKEIKDLDNIPPPDYDDYDWSLYPIRRVSIWGSRGCVRECTFCDIHEHWSKFTWRSATSIFQEMKYQIEKYGINFFSFADSLVNGNQKEFRMLIKLLADYNQTLSSEQKIRWTGYFIFRPKEQMGEKDWKLMTESGCTLLLVGIESFVEHIRYHIKKKFSNQDIDHGLLMAKKYGISVSLLTIIGYVTETQEDFDQQLQWVRVNRLYANNPVVNIEIGSGLGILPGTWLHRNIKELGIKLSSTQVFQDWERESINSTPELRNKWRQEMMRVLTENGFKFHYNTDNHVMIESYIMQKYGKNKDKTVL